MLFCIVACTDARTLQLANIPFRMVTKTGTVVVKPSTSAAGGAGPTANTVTIKAPRSTQAPPFAQPGIDRMRQQQADQRKRKHSDAGTSPTPDSTAVQDTPENGGAGGRTTFGGTNGRYNQWTSGVSRKAGATKPRQPDREVSMSPTEFSHQLEVALYQTRPLAAPATAVESQPVSASAGDHASNAAPAAAALDLASHRQRLIQNHNRTATQLSKHQKTASSGNRKATAQASQRSQAQQQQVEDTHGDSLLLMPFTAPLPLSTTSSTVKRVNANKSRINDGVGQSSSGGSLFSHIFSGAGNAARGNPSGSDASPNYLEQVTILAAVLCVQFGVELFAALLSDRG
jgi:hypothetical protein